MRKPLTAAAIALGLLTGAAHAAPTCHQRVVMAPSKPASDAFTVNRKVSDMVTDQALDFISATSNVDMVVKGKAYVDAVAAATADVTDTQINDDIKVMMKQVLSNAIASFNNTNKYTKDPVSNNKSKSGHLLSVNLDIIKAFLVCAK